jgi:uncharacterized protein with gpF-like domain
MVHPSVSKVKVQNCEKHKERGREKNKGRFSDHPTGQNKREVQSTLKISTYDTLMFLVTRNRKYSSGNIHSIVCFTTGP